MKKVVIGIGISGSGKTTFLKKYAEENNFSYICVDDIREEITGSAIDQSKNTEAWQIAYDRLVNSLRKGESVVFDSTMTSMKTRGELISFVKQNTRVGEYIIKGVVFNTPLEVAMQQNSSRVRVVPEHVLHNQNQALYNFRPLAREGFDTLETFETFQKSENSILDKVSQELNKVK